MSVVDWLLDPVDPAVRAAALRRLQGRGTADPDVVTARAAAMGVDPIAGLLAGQDPAGWWGSPGPAYGPKYSSTVWRVIFLGQLGADPDDERVRRAADYLLRWAPTTPGGWGAGPAGLERVPPPSSVAHCLNGNLVRALAELGRAEDPRVLAGADWAARVITGADGVRYYASSACAPGFACGANDGRPCAWGAVKELRALAAVPPALRSDRIRAAIDAGVAFLLSRDPAVADYPMGYGNTRPNGSWFRLGFPCGYVTDVLQVLEVLGELGHGEDPRLAPARAWLVGQRGSDGRWANRYAYNGKTAVDVERQGAPSKWVTLRALAVLGAAAR